MTAAAILNFEKC